MRAVDGASCVVYTAVTRGALEIAAARAKGTPVVHRMQVLQQVSGDKRLVAVAGTHGKSTTSGMVVAALQSLGVDPSFLIGADFDVPGSGAHSGAGGFFVAEADESDRAFHFLSPAAAVVTTIAHDHPENYADLDEHVDAYLTFVSRMQDRGVLVANADEDTSRDLVRRARVLRPDLRVVTFGVSAAADVRMERFTVDGWTSRVDVVAGQDRYAIRQGNPSVRHGLDAVAALALLLALGHSPASAAEAISSFRGINRRFSLVGKAGGVAVVDCHADHHHEIAADLDAARKVAGDGRVIAVVQPSGYARVQAFGRQMGATLAAGSDCTILLDVYGTAPIPGVTSSIVGDAVITAGGAARFATRDEVPGLVSAQAVSGDVVILLGAGDVGALAAPILSEVATAARVTV